MSTTKNPIKFFIDTGDIAYIRQAWSQLSTIFDGEALVGITTNPNAMAKINAHTLADFEKAVLELTQFVSEARQDNKGVVYVQHPSSNVTIPELFAWAEFISTLGDKQTKVALKIPPYQPILEQVSKLNQIVDVNVTGVADCATALNCFTYSDVRYVSIIPGRMEEKGINATEQLLYVNQRRHGRGEVITGSMRTIEGLQRAIEANTVPTIGARVFDAIFAENNGIQKFHDMWNYTPAAGFIKFAPLVTADMTQLSVDFFNQMDELGSQLAQDIQKKGLPDTNGRSLSSQISVREAEA